MTDISKELHRLANVLADASYKLRPEESKTEARLYEMVLDVTDVVYEMSQRLEEPTGKGEDDDSTES